MLYLNLSPRMRNMISSLECWQRSSPASTNRCTTSGKPWMMFRRKLKRQVINSIKTLLRTYKGFQTSTTTMALYNHKALLSTQLWGRISSSSWSSRQGISRTSYWILKRMGWAKKAWKRKWMLLHGTEDSWRFFLTTLCRMQLFFSRKPWSLKISLTSETLI